MDYKIVIRETGCFHWLDTKEEAEEIVELLKSQHPEDARQFYMKEI